jgi:hypothetical protein
VGKPITLDASGSHDPDGQALHFHWFHYGEAGGTGTNLATVTIAGAESAKAIVTPTAVCRGNWLQAAAKCSGDGVAHVILAVTDEGTPNLTSYRRIILTVHGGTAP